MQRPFLESIPQPISQAAQQRSLVYLASPVACYQTSRYDQMLAHASMLFPDADVLPARGLYVDSAHWEATWPFHLKRLAIVVFFADIDGSIGRGVFVEVADAISAGLPVHYLQDDGSLLPFKRMRLELLNGGTSWRRYARVRVLPDATQTTKRVKKGARRVAS